jgi:photosystem II stability/assembly factor-like uncharacterized protein
MATIDDILSQVAVNPDFPTDNPDSAVATIDDIELISFSPESALLLVTFGEKAPLSSSLMRTHTVVIKTSDGGNNWRLTLDATGGSLVKEEIFFLDENHGWFITQWQVEATFPTLYWTADFGETWQESLAIHEFIASKGRGVSFTTAEGLRFSSENEGIVLAIPPDPEEEKPLYFIKTTDSGKTWIEIDHIPPEYFTWKSQHQNKFSFDNPWTITATNSGFSVQKSLGEFSKMYQAAISNG